MFRKRFGILTLIVACFCSAFLAFGLMAMALQSITGNLPEATKFLRTMGLIKLQYVGEVDEHKLFEGALKGMVNSLGDPYSVYLDQEQYHSLLANTEGHFGGIGVVLGMKEDNFVVIAPLKDTPGERAGIKSGDKIIAINGAPTAGQTLEEVVTKIRGEKGTEVEISLVQTDGTEMTVRVIRSDIKLDTVIGEMKEDGIGYIRIGMFNESTADDFTKKFHELEAAGMRGLVLDLRDNPGGLLDSSVKVAGMLVPEGPIVSVTERSGKTMTEYSHLKEAKYPAAVLVNQGSASAAEIVAGALQDTKVGYLFGTKTFGKGSVQTVNNLDGNSGMKLTVAHYFTPSGRSINGVGIEPNTVVEPTDAAGENQVGAAVVYLKNKLAQ